MEEIIKILAPLVLKLAALLLGYKLIMLAYGIFLKVANGQFNLAPDKRKRKNETEEENDDRFNYWVLINFFPVIVVSVIGFAIIYFVLHNIP